MDDYYNDLYGRINILMEEGHSDAAILEELCGEADSEYLNELIAEAREEQ